MGYFEVKKAVVTASLKISDKQKANFVYTTETCVWQKQLIRI